MRVDHPRAGIVRLRRPVPDGLAPVTTFALTDGVAPSAGPAGNGVGDLDVRIDDEGAGFTVVRRDGTPLLAGATVEARPGVHGEAHTLRWRPDPDEALYGWGEWALPPDRRGRRLVSWNTDAFRYRTGERSLYGTYPLLLAVRDGVASGLFWNDPHRTTLDLRGEEATLVSDGGVFDLFLLAGPAPADVIEQYTALTGRPPLWPRWSLGLHQSRWGYETSDKVREIARGYRSRGIPCDAIHLDIEHMRGYRIFTFDPDRFGDGPELVRDLHAQGFRVVSIEDPGVKLDPEWELAREAQERGLVVRRPDGSPFVGIVWPGDCVFPDFTHAPTREWWSERARRWVAESGVDGLWNDMNEPPLFHAPYEEIEEGLGVEFHALTMPDDSLHRIDGVEVDHRTAHNLYGAQMVRGTWEGLQGERRPFVLSRSGFAGVQRHAFIWTGDNTASWEHLRLAVHMLVSLGLSGVPFSGADVGGFTGSPEPELLLRFAQVGVLMPLMRIHCQRDSDPREPWTLAEPHAGHFRAAIELRYRLLPYLYTLADEAARTGAPPLRPLWWTEPGERRLHEAPDVVLLGADIVAAPVLDEGADEVSLPLPSGRWRELDGSAVHESSAALAAPLDRLPLLVRCGAVTPLGGEQPVLRVDLDPVAGPLAGAWYDDDGETHDHLDGGFRRAAYDGLGGPDGFTLTATYEGERAAVGSVLLEVHGLADVHADVTVDEDDVASSWTEDGVLRFVAPAGFALVRVAVRPPAAS